MAMVTVKTAELEGTALDWAVAVTQGLDGPIDGVYIMPIEHHKDDGTQRMSPVWIDGEKRYQPSTSWAEGGPLIEKLISDLVMTAKGWSAVHIINADSEGSESYADTPLIAAMRAIVAAELGETAEIPEELLK